jgi:hypothetical protein
MIGELQRAAGALDRAAVVDALVQLTDDEFAIRVLEASYILDEAMRRRVALAEAEEPTPKRKTSPKSRTPKKRQRAKAKE